VGPQPDLAGDAVRRELSLIDQPVDIADRDAEQFGGAY
jgi:hypothetical protein